MYSRSVLLLLTLALPALAPAQSEPVYVGRPIYQEPGAGLQLPPGCTVDPTWRARLPNSDLELWIVDCHAVVRTWLLRRTVIEVVNSNQSRLRLQVLDERQWPGEVAGTTASVQCVGRTSGETGVAIVGAKWRQSGNELRLTSASGAVRADPATLRLVPLATSQVDCLRFPEREAMLRRLQTGPG